MKEILSTDSREVSIRKFDDCMSQLFTECTHFVNEYYRIRQSDEHPMKLRILGIGFTLDLQLSNKIADHYASILSNSMLDIRTEEHLHLIERIDRETQGISKIVTDDDRHSFRDILDHIAHLRGTLFGLSQLENTRSDNDYAAILKNTRQAFYETPAWQAAEAQYKDLLSTRRGTLKELSLEQLQQIYDQLGWELTSDQDLGIEWTAYGAGDASLFSRAICLKHFTTDREINILFARQGRLQIIAQWIEERRLAVPVAEEQIGEECLAQKVTFCGRWSEEWFVGKWPEMKQIILDSHNTDSVWCCLYHVLSFYKIISPVSFETFINWLNAINGKELISPRNILSVANSYYAQNACVVWTLTALEKHLQRRHEKLTTRQIYKFDRYTKLCELLKGI